LWSEGDVLLNASAVEGVSTAIVAVVSLGITVRVEIR
jgi:hypothetical protein